MYINQRIENQLTQFNFLILIHHEREDGEPINIMYMGIFNQ